MPSSTSLMPSYGRQARWRRPLHPPFPSERQDQARVILIIISATKALLSAEEIAASFTSSGDTVAEVRDVLRSLARIGQAKIHDNGRSHFRLAS